MATLRFPIQTNRINRLNSTKGYLNNIEVVAVGAFFGVTVITSPIVNIISFSKAKISDENTQSICNVVFNCNTSITAWEARATNETITPIYGAGLLVGSGTALTANTTTSFDVDYSELTQGDRVYTISIYVQYDGSWY